MSKSHYMSMKERINNAKTVSALTRLDASMRRLWEVGVFTVNEFQKLDAVWCDRRNELQS